MMELPFKPSPQAFVEYVEGALGWAPDPSMERWRALAVEANKLKRKIATNPALYTYENLALTVEWLRRQRKVITTPTSICWSVAYALKDSATSVTPAKSADVAQDIVAAIELEQTRRGSDWRRWVNRLTRAAGAGREEVLAEWQEARR